MTQYPLGTTDQELERLTFQHEVWGPVTRAFLARIGVGAGARVLDLGCGPGLVTYDLAELVGPRGEVVALDESARWIEHVERELVERRLSNARVLRARIQEVELEPESFDFVITRWVLSFLPDPAGVVRRIARSLKPGGVFAVEDYNHEGVSLFPESEGFRAVVRATRAMYTQSGGDAWVAARAPAIFRAAGLETISIVPNVLCGGPDSPAFRWAGTFFPHFSQPMEAKGLLTSAERRQFLEEWAARAADPNAMFFSPVVVDAAARKPHSAF